MTSADETPHGLIHDAPLRRPPSPSPMLPVTPPELDQDIDLLGQLSHVAEDLDQLVHWLSSKPILHGPFWQHAEEGAEGEGEDKDYERIVGMRFQCGGPGAFSPQMPMPSELTPPLDPVSELSMQCPPCPSIPPLHDPFQSPDPCEQDIQSKNASSKEKPSQPFPSSNDSRRPRRSTETRLRSASNARMLDLVTGMIKNGVQCNVQDTAPPSPTRKWSSSSIFSSVPRFTEWQNTIDPRTPPSNIELGVDGTFNKLDGGTTFDDNVTLRLVSAPAGIRKLGPLRYRSSSEAAQSCRNVKRNVPRMRRRGRTISTIPPLPNC
ncbi:hypothetical protein GGR50DRAFT_1543 [Xylaria sp. CBS 124048]|nr:hypothetical protein GGR50DRAFT_1543 [Xylaria sp. CBS 124048]